MSPGENARGKGNKRWPDAKNAECFARIHYAICTRETKLSVASAAKNLADKTGWHKKDLERRYRKYNCRLKVYFDDNDIKEIVLKSFGETLTKESDAPTVSQASLQHSPQGPEQS